MNNPVKKSRLVTPSDMGIHRISFCWKCNNRVDNELRDECGKCGWIKCKCGACGCGYKRGTSEKSDSPSTRKSTEVREVDDPEKDKVVAVTKCDKIIKKAFARLRNKEEVEDREVVLKWFQDKILDIKKEFDGYIYLSDLMFLIASETKDLIEANRGNQAMLEILLSIRNKWIRLAPPDVSRSGKAFWSLKNQEYNKIRNKE